ncbi:hypothetical protein SAMN05421741_101277 [Paenimyroides ummariense]|uniref:Uncharacterized protein n=1 Tax=Paenimyroides ummariense TaxID=913024 RepID=A0A1I4WLB0_9FLAO|nr:hypothetical protein [Paenimyroides ummariense]SFN13982.1 hypothetical protein SAMN05421741_101277 [Paenimyroides ummariense]
MKTVYDLNLTEQELSNDDYKFQPELTSILDNINVDFDQSIINQIVLWKVNRYSQLDKSTLLLLNQVDKHDLILNADLTEKILRNLLSTKGVQLAMASTILRFKNPNIYQIIDQRVYRLIYGKIMPKYFSSIDIQIELYLGYLEKLREVCNHKQIDFILADRILYDLDKKYNKDEKIKY